MDNEAMDARILFWTGKASQILGDLVDRTIPILDQTDMNRADWIVRQLFVMAHTSSEGALYLIRVERAWGGEMLVRSIAESTAKLAYIELAAEGVRDTRARDFWEVGLDLASLDDDKRIKEFLTAFPDAAKDPMFRPYREILLTDEKRAALESLYSNSFRREHKRRWSFREVLRVLGDEGHQMFGDFARGPYWYSIPSHVLHSDAFAVATAWDRFHNRTEEQRLAMEVAHAARLIGDILSFGYMRLYALARRRQIPRAKVKEWWLLSRDLRRAMHGTHEDFRDAVYDDDEADKPSDT
jgi:hypothetical protein